MVTLNLLLLAAWTISSPTTVRFGAKRLVSEPSLRFGLRLTQDLAADCPPIIRLSVGFPAIHLVFQSAFRLKAA
jgi:hypothetical protein